MEQHAGAGGRLKGVRTMYALFDQMKNSLPNRVDPAFKEFAGCSGCRSVVQCCLNHQALDWRAHKKLCRMTVALKTEETADEEQST